MDGTRGNGDLCLLGWTQNPTFTWPSQIFCKSSPTWGRAVLQVNKASKSTKTQLLFFPHVPGLSLINPIPRKWKAESFSAFGVFQTCSFQVFFPWRFPGAWARSCPASFWWEGHEKCDLPSRNGRIRRTGLDRKGQGSSFPQETTGRGWILEGNFCRAPKSLLSSWQQCQIFHLCPLSTPGKAICRALGFL